MDRRLDPVLGRHVIVGHTRIMGCCVFTWREFEGRADRTVEVREDHCERCVAEIARLGYALRGAGTPQEHEVDGHGNTG